MKDITKYITEHNVDYHMDDVKKAIKDVFDKHKKEWDAKKFKDWLFDIGQETKDDIDDQDNSICDNDGSDTWRLMKEVAKIIGVDVEDLWEDCGGSYLFIETIMDLDK